MVVSLLPTILLKQLTRTRQKRFSHLSSKQDRRPVTDDRKQEHPCLLAVVGLLSSVALEMSNDKGKIFWMTSR
jgi:hypothetical protein